MSIVVMFWIGVAVQGLTFMELLRRKMAWKLLFFSMLVFAMFIRNTVLGLNFNTGNYLQIQSTTAPWMSALQILATVQAFWWLTTSLANFAKYGVWMFVIITGAAVGWERWTAGPRLDIDSAIQSLYALERGVGLALGISMLVAALSFGLLGAPRAPKWHAFSLAALFVGHAVAWQFMSNYVLISSCMMALAAWCSTVHQPPTWTPVQGSEFPREAIDRKWKAADREASGF